MLFDRVQGSAEYVPKTIAGVSPSRKVFLLWMLHDFGGRVQGGSDIGKNKRERSTMSKGVVCEGVLGV